MLLALLVPVWLNGSRAPGASDWLVALISGGRDSSRKGVAVVAGAVMPGPLVLLLGDRRRTRRLAT